MPSFLSHKLDEREAPNTDEKGGCVKRKKKICMARCLVNDDLEEDDELGDENKNRNNGLMG